MLCTVQLQWDNKVLSPYRWVLGILLPWKEVCSFHAMINPVSCCCQISGAILPLPPHSTCSCCSSWAGCSTDIITWEHDHLVEPLKKGFGVCFTAHSCTTVRFKTKQEVEKHRLSSSDLTQQRKRQRQGTVKSLTLDSNLRLLWAGCPRSQPFVRSSWQTRPQCSWHRSAWSRRIPSHPQSAKGRGRQSPYEARGA